jgi:hypothetical protein
MVLVVEVYEEPGETIFSCSGFSVKNKNKQTKEGRKKETNKNNWLLCKKTTLTAPNSF